LDNTNNTISDKDYSEDELEANTDATEADSDSKPPTTTKNNKHTTIKDITCYKTKHKLLLCRMHKTSTHPEATWPCVPKYVTSKDVKNDMICTVIHDSQFGLTFVTASHA
jgi:hypothetical protein